MRPIRSTCCCVLLLLATCGGRAQDFVQAKAKFDAADFNQAARDFEAVANAGHNPRRAEAAVFVLRSYSQAGNHQALEASFEHCLSVAGSTPFEAECLFERAKSTQVNLKDYGSATEQYNRILAEHPGNVFAASGSLYQRGTIELDVSASALAAYSSFEQMIAQYPASPFVDDALVAEARAGSALARLDIIENCRARLGAMHAAPAMMQKAQWECAEFYNKMRRDRVHALVEYTAVFESWPIKSEAAAMARIRAADLVPAGHFRAAIAMYDQAMADYPKLKKNHVDWCISQKAIYNYQCGNEEAAAQLFGQLLERKPVAKLVKCARLHLDGIANPESTSALVIVYDRALRQKETDNALDSTFWDLQRVIEKSRKPFFRQFADDASLDKEERAQMLYRLAFARFYCGYANEAYELTEEVLKRVAPKGVTRLQCEYMQAFLTGRAGRWDEAAQAWQRFIDSSTGSELQPRAYLEHSRALYFAGDSLGAVLALEELRVRYPASVQTEEATLLLEEHFLRDPNLRELLSQKQPLIAAKWKRQSPSQPSQEQTDSLEITGGGAQ